MECDHPAKKARKRVKLECLQCGSQFDDDWRKKHEQKCHKGMRVQVKVSGAPSNPFVASVRRTKNQHAVNTETTNQNLPVDATVAITTDKELTATSSEKATESSSPNYFYDLNSLSSELQCVSPAIEVSSTPTIPPTAKKVEYRDVEVQETENYTEASISNTVSEHAHGPSITVNSLSSELQCVSPAIEVSSTPTIPPTAEKVEYRDVEVQETENYTEASISNTVSEHAHGPSITEYDQDFGEEIHISVLKCAGHFKHLVDCLNDSKPIIEKLTQSDEISILPFLMETIDIITRTKENCSSLLNICGKILKEVETW